MDEQALFAQLETEPAWFMTPEERYTGMTFFRSTEASCHPVFNLPTSETFQELGIGEVRILAITASGQMLDYAALLEHAGTLDQIDLVDFNPRQNFFTAYILSQIYLAGPDSIALRNAIMSAGVKDVLRIIRCTAFQLFPELEEQEEILDIPLKELVKTFKCIDSASIDPKVFTAGNFTRNFYFLHNSQLLSSLREAILAGKICFYREHIESFKPKDTFYHVIYLSDITPWLNLEKLYLLFDTLDQILDPCGFCQVSGYGTDCLSIADGCCTRDDRLLAMLMLDTEFETQLQNHCWMISIERSLQKSLGFKDLDKWQEFRQKGPAGLPPKQHLPIIIYKPGKAETLFGKVEKEFYRL